MHITDSEASTRFYSAQNGGLVQRKNAIHAMRETGNIKKKLKVSSPIHNTGFIRRLTRKKAISDEKAKKHSAVAIGDGIVEEELTNDERHHTNKREGPGQNASDGFKAPQTARFLADYGILGISEDEDSAKWAADEIRKIPLKTSNTKKLSQQIQSSETFEKAISQNKIVSKVGKTKAPDLEDNLHILSDIFANETKPGNLIQNATNKTSAASVHLSGQLYATNNNIRAQPPLTQGNGTKPQNGTSDTVKMAKTNGKTSQSNTLGNTTASLEQTTSGVKLTSAGFPSQSNQTSNNEPSSYKYVPTNNKSTEDKASSLFINVTRLRTGQSFDLQMPTSISSKGTYQDNHFHISPQESVQSSAEHLLKEVRSESNNSNFINQTRNKVKTIEPAQGRQPYTLLQKLNSDIVAARAEPLITNENSGTEVINEAFREEAPAGRTFADNVLESTTSQALFNRKENGDQGIERQTEIQQDEGLARALNTSSVSSIIFSANQAILDTDNQVFSKKSAQENVDSKEKEHRSKRNSFFHHLAKHHSTKNLALKQKLDNELHHKATARQVINLGNHFLWFGGQSSADANGFPRHNTAAEIPQYNVNSYASNLLNSENENNTPSATKGYKALQNALSSMESNQEEQGYSEFQFGIPSENKSWQDTNEGQTPTSVLIQDDAGKPVYQGLVHILKLNETKSNYNNVSSEVESQAKHVFSGQKEEISNKTKNHPLADSLMNKTINNQSAIADFINSLKPNATSHEDSSNEGNKTETQGSVGSTVREEGTNLTLSKETGVEENPTQEMKGVNHTIHGQSSTHHLQSEFQDDQKLSNDAQSTDSQDSNTKQPSAIIKQLSTPSNEPETYHVILNDSGKTITNSNGHVTVIISGPTAKEAIIPAENTLLIPQTDSNGSSSNILSNNNSVSFLSKDQDAPLQSDQVSHSNTTANQRITSQSTQYADNAALTLSKAYGPLSLFKDDALSALRISEGIEGQRSKGQMQKEKPSSEETSQNKTDTEGIMQQGHHFVNVGQDLKGGVDGLQMEEVSRPVVQEKQQQEKENPLMEPAGGGFLEGLEKSMAEQSQDVPILNIVLDPTQKIGGSLSVGGKVVPITSMKQERDSTKGQNQHLDCHADPKNGKTIVTVLTCQKKHSLPIIPRVLSNEAYFDNQKMSGSPSLQLDQVMNVLNDQVKTTINKEMKTESKDIQKMLTGMTVPSSTLMDVDEAYSESERPQPSPIGPDETYTSPPVIERQHRRNHRKIRHFGFLPHFGFPNHFGSPHRRHFWGNHRHTNPLVVMAHKDSDDGYWDYQHNIFIPGAVNHEDDDDEEEDKRETHWAPWANHGNRRGNWLMAHPPFHHPRFSPFRHHDLFNLRLPTLFGRSGPWKTSLFEKQEQGTKRTAVVHKTVREDRDLCKPIIEGPSPPLKGEWEYLGKVLSSCPCRLSDTEW